MKQTIPETICQYLKSKKITKTAFACEFIDFMPYRVECTKSWTVQVTRWLNGKTKCRWEVQQAMQFWLKSQKNKISKTARVLRNVPESKWSNGRKKQSWEVQQAFNKIQSKKAKRK